jgi:hypothetical protein
MQNNAKQCKTMQNNAKQCGVTFSNKGKTLLFQKIKSKINGTPSSVARALKPGDLVKITDCNFENVGNVLIAKDPVTVDREDGGVVVEDTLLYIKKSRKGQELPTGHVYASKCTIKIVKSKKDADVEPGYERAPEKSSSARVATRQGPSSDDPTAASGAVNRRQGGDPDGVCPWIR